MKINPEVFDAIKNNKPVVALESTIISHGMPYPKNVACALEVEKVIRENGAIPATIGIINGEPIIGMTNDEIEEFGKRKGIIKCSRRDLPIIISEKEWGATTVSATMILANLAGIEFFVTGGIGGVHRGAQETFDISADLDELGRTNVTVICAGPKAILDLNLTMEYLETKGVPVLAYNSDKLPAFFTRTSDLNVDYNVKNPAEIASIVKNKRDYKLDGGVLVCNPIPEDYSMDPNYINKEIDKAIDEMNKLGIKGKEETPFLLSKIVELTNGKSLEANIKLILNNAALGAKAAIEYCKLRG
ncbi:MAG: pseudouridine-5'-phosphate glycosidase [Mollicutes bacterium]|nr:pseudouridine-5'-phosphate glycosidase [Mollicutes bacterium]MDD7263463.1 pseudouridine-5'-phosphate glycosidase [bacterium]MDY4979272.1 pseudouridine-5'-phosphate glycosidase [Candidatus Onthovivens sp.]